MGTGMADALFTRTQQRVLGLLFGNPHRTFYAKEIIRRAGAGSGAVQRELARLVASDLVLVTAVGNQRHYQANPASPIFAELRSLIVKTSGVVGPLRDALESLGARVRLALSMALWRGAPIAPTAISTSSSSLMIWPWMSSSPLLPL
jgi:hypothetical protein